MGQMLVRPPAIPAAPDAATALVHFAERNVIKRRKQITRLDARERLRDLGSQEVKGIAEPVVTWMVEGVSASESRFEAVRAAGLSDLIGREDELDFLLERQWLAWKGEGQIVLISGESGIGKSPGRFSAAPCPIVMTPMRRVRLWPALDQASRSLQ